MPCPLHHQKASHHLPLFTSARLRMCQTEVSCRGVQQLRRELKRHADWNAQLEAMKTGATMGSLHVEANGLKLSLKPIIASAHTQVCVSSMPVPFKNKDRKDPLGMWLHAMPIRALAAAMLQSLGWVKCSCWVACTTSRGFLVYLGFA